MNYDTQATSFIAAGRAKSSLPFFMRLGLPGLIAPQEFFSCQVMVRHSSNTEGKSLIATRIWKSGRIARSFSEIMQKNRHRILHWLQGVDRLKATRESIMSLSSMQMSFFGYSF